jgi:hypothetical protein
MARSQSVINLDPIDRANKKRSGIFGRTLKTRPHGGKPVKKTDAIGHYLFAGKQRAGKTVSALWFAEYLTKKYEKKGYKIILYSNLEIGIPITKYSISPKIREIVYNPKEIHIFIIDEIHGYFPKDTRDKMTLLEVDKLTQDFSQLAKKNIYVLSTAQVYGRVNKNIREQCLYMVYCRRSKLNKKVVNDFIDGDDILCDELGRWSGEPKFIMTHGLPKTDFNTHRMITE